MTAGSTSSHGLKHFQVAVGAALPLLLGIAHLVVDASSNFAMMILLRPASFSDAVGLLVAYNFGAFALQPLVGWATNRLGKPRAALSIGLILAAAALLCLDLPRWVPLLLTSLGNALFHVGGGALASLSTEGRASGPGVFIAPGAIGVALGAAAGESAPAALWPLFSALLVFAVLGGMLRCRETPTAEAAAAPSRREGAEAIVFLLLFAIAARSLLGARALSQLRIHPGWALPLAAAAFAGKAFGGWIADRFGWKRVAVASLLLSSALLAAAGRSVFVAVSAMICFQAVTSITLSALYKAIPGRIGFAFGLACLAIFVGAFPLLIRVDWAALGVIPVDPLLALASLLAVWRSLSLLEEGPSGRAIESIPSRP